MKELDRYRLAFENLPDGAESAEANCKKLDIISVSVKDGEAGDSSAYTQFSVQVSVYANGSVGKAVTQDVEEDPNELIKRAMNCAAFSPGCKKPEKGPRLVRDAADDGADFDQLKALAVKLEKAALGRPGVKAVQGCSAERKLISYEVVSTQGPDLRFSDLEYSVSIGARIEINGAEDDCWCVSYADRLSDIDADAVADRLMKKAALNVCALPVMTPPTGEYDVVFGAEPASMIMVTSFMGCAGSYTALSAPVYPFHPETIIKYEKTVPETWADGKREPVLPESYPDGRWSVPVNKSGTAEIAADAVRVFIKPTNDGVGELIKTMKNGLYVTGSYDIIHSISRSTGEFAIFCDGIIVKDGKTAGRFERAIISGSMQQYMRNMARAADDLSLPGFMNPSYSYGSPSVLIKGLKVTGKA